jgi:hypothetical protein
MGSNNPGAGGPGGLQKLGSLERIDFQAQAIAQGAVSGEDEKYLKMPPEDLYHELIKFEAKRFYFDKNITLIQQSFEKGQIGEADMRGSKERLKFELDRVLEQIGKIRNILIPAK